MSQAVAEATAETPTTAAAKPLTTFCEAAVAYLIAKDDDAFFHCVNICKQKLGKLWLSEGEPRTQLDLKGWLRDSSYDSTRFFVACFLLEKFEPFRNFPPESVRRLAAEGAFRNWPRQCKSRLIDQLRKQYTRHRRLQLVPFGSSIDLEIFERVRSEDANAREHIQAAHLDDDLAHLPLGSPVVRDGKLATYPQVIATRNEPGSPLFQIDAAALQSWYAEKSDALSALLSAEQQATLEAIITTGAPQGAAQVKAIVTAKRVTEQTARTHLKRLMDRMKKIRHQRPDLLRIAEEDIKRIGWRDRKGHRFRKAED